jgi:hypothetical protein
MTARSRAEWHSSPILSALMMGSRATGSGLTHHGRPAIILAGRALRVICRPVIRSHGPMASSPRPSVLVAASAIRLDTRDVPTRTLLPLRARNLLGYRLVATGYERARR